MWLCMCYTLDLHSLSDALLSEYLTSPNQLRFILWKTNLRFNIWDKIILCRGRIFELHVHDNKKPIYNIDDDAYAR